MLFLLSSRTLPFLGPYRTSVLCSVHGLVVESEHFGLLVLEGGGMRAWEMHPSCGGSRDGCQEKAGNEMSESLGSKLPACRFQVENQETNTVTVITRLRTHLDHSRLFPCLFQDNLPSRQVG